jgi:hypothetical protein
MSSKFSKNGAYKVLVTQKDAITKIMGIITPESINTLKNELGGAFTILKSTHFTKGEQYEYLTCVIPEEKYRIIIADLVGVYVAPVNPGAYAAAAFAAGVSGAQQEQITAQPKETQIACTEYLGAQEAGKELLLYGVCNDALVLLKKQYINYGNAIIHSMIQHLPVKTAIKMTTSQKFKYKAEGYGKQWDPRTSITAYFTSLDKFGTSLTDRGITTSNKKMTMAAGVRMWESEMFTEDQMVAWENKTPVQQTWQNLQDYFTEKWLEQRQYLQATAKQLRFKDAALTSQELAAAEAEGKTTAMMFVLLQEQHKAQLEAMGAANKQGMDAMLECMNALIAGQGKAADKPTATVPNSNQGNAPNTANRKKKYAQTAESLFSTNCRLATS